jgi:hypothetical protein
VISCFFLSSGAGVIACIRALLQKKGRAVTGWDKNSEVQKGIRPLFRNGGARLNGLKQNSGLCGDGDEERGGCGSSGRSVSPGEEIDARDLDVRSGILPGGFEQANGLLVLGAFLVRPRPGDRELCIRLS